MRRLVFFLIAVTLILWGCAPTEPPAIDTRLSVNPVFDGVAHIEPAGSADIEGMTVFNNTQDTIAVDGAELGRLANALWPDGQGWFPDVVILSGLKQALFVDSPNGCNVSGTNESFVACLVAYRLDYDQALMPTLSAVDIAASLQLGTIYTSTSTADGAIANKISAQLPRMFNILSVVVK